MIQYGANNTASKHISRDSATIIYDVLVLISKYIYHHDSVRHVRASLNGGCVIIIYFNRFTQQRYYDSRNQRYNFI